MGISVNFDPILNVYFKKISGSVTITQVRTSLQDRTQFDLTRNLFIVDDVLKAKFNFKFKDLYSFINKTQQNLPENILIFHAVVSTSKAINLFAKAIAGIKNHRYQVQVFSNQQAALNWLQEKQKVFGATTL